MGFWAPEALEFTGTPEAQALLEANVLPFLQAINASRIYPDGGAFLLPLL